MFFPAASRLISPTIFTVPLVLLSLRISPSSSTGSPSVCLSPSTVTSTVGSAFAMWKVSSAFFDAPFFAVRISVVFTLSVAFSGVPESTPSAVRVKPSGSALGKVCQAGGVRRGARFPERQGSSRNRSDPAHPFSCDMSARWYRLCPRKAGSPPALSSR